MKKIFIISFLLLSISSFSQTSIIGDNKCMSPYSGNDEILIRRINVPVGEWVECVIPTNIVTVSSGTSITIQHWAGASDETNGWRMAGNDGIVIFNFNASLFDAVVSATMANGWVLPSGKYNISTRLFSDKTGASIQNVEFEIIGSNSVSMVKAIRNKNRK